MEYNRPIGEQPIFDPQQIEELRAYAFGLFSFSDAQRRVNRWEGEIFEPHERTPQRAIIKGQEEMEEVRYPMNEFMDGREGYAEELALEGRDVIIAMIGIINALGYDAGELVQDGLDYMETKYNLKRNGELKALGHTSRERIDIMKQEWNNNGT